MTMGERESLLLVLALVYVSECAFWLGRNDVLFATWLGRRWRPGIGGPVLPNERGGFRFAPVLPPFGTALLVRTLPLSLSPDGALSWTSVSLNPVGRPPQIGRFVKFDDVKSVERDGRKVFVNGELFLKVPTSVHARFVSRLLATQAKLPREQREKDQRALLQKSFDVSAVKKRIEEAQPKLKRLRVLAHLLFTSLFVGLPVALFGIGLSRCWPIVLAVLLAQTIAQSVLFVRAHKTLFGDDRDDDRFTQQLTMLVAMPAAIRAHDCLTMNLLAETHPLAAARALCSPEDFRELARRALLDQRFPRLPMFSSENAGANGTEACWRGALLEATEKFLRDEGLNLEELLAPPAPGDPGNRSFCPRCRAQFVTADGACTDCGGRALEPFPAKA